MPNMKHPVLETRGLTIVHRHGVLLVVTQDETERQRARERWKHYLAQGCSITRHDLSGQGGQ